MGGDDVHLRCLARLQLKSSYLPINFLQLQKLALKRSLSAKPKLVAPLSAAMPSTQPTKKGGPSRDRPNSSMEASKA
ncbi:hypothetical protein D3M59_09880 [Sphingomonas edaphi]|uniref:Uncharacterized protein n=1 Tax=Sphingomonas edaphi TaxID=2315689 RepID=A0A418PYJ2_9SPHN|nr:hypothetical protein D3M59_09880 [Sphingomonas edaphi]